MGRGRNHRNKGAAIRPIFIECHLLSVARRLDVRRV